MKKVSVDSLKGNEILALPVVSDNDIVLIHADVVLTSDLINRIHNIGLYEVYIKDDLVNETKEENHVELPKQEEPVHVYKVEETIENSREVIKSVLEKHIYKHNEELKQIGREAERIIDSVLEEPEVITNITEIRNVSTDMYTHCINVCSLSTIMALRLRMSEKQVRNVSLGAILHDIGLRYIKVPYINVTESDMSDKDAIEYKKHTIFGYSSIQDETWLTDVAKEIILLHHERIDGSGYPFQQTGDKLRSEVKLVSICDEFDSLISGIGNRKLKIYEAIEYLKVHAGTTFDAAITEKLLDSVAAFPVGITVITDKGEKGVVIRQNREYTDRPVIKMTFHADGTPYEENIEKNLMTELTMFIVDTE
ncbi:MAG: HD domain-containing protein [Lachnospira sp.]|uniref:HD-GYP domain, c-di-GMP phosphodiesterase class II (Or its inactivated variant) n=1 Tax=Lachnospira pectinoschiza TaxID=28052 RepID=A0A1G9YQI8_9FIRM|nr:HD domain-containing phosphohydrolase [Lachnospira pectinoschiza]MCR5515816.1 HD domain-containing protein [Lachnospira sp.]SDN10855.1 HD-GYP domain, c-di-GMP phosphodiesterase class II (or its inactivated variant) [Lachnospira pectinoschiza]